MSGEHSSSFLFLAMREEEEMKRRRQQLQQQEELVVQQHEQEQVQQAQHGLPLSSSAAQTQQQLQAPPKRRRNQPGTPNPDAEIIALSPKTLMATNRFVCEVCNKGFQREQNLQLHRRGHNLPWKLKQKSTKEVKKKVYLCPEPSCVHHEPSRALGDLTGIKKHYSRKHGEKKYKCDKCSKKYAVQSDWKAHSKTCGTREYRCDCGTLFSRRDSFITHRAFCDALAQESARNPSGLSCIGSHLYGSSNNTMSLGVGRGNGDGGSGSLKINSQIPDHNNILHFGGSSNSNNIIMNNNNDTSSSIKTITSNGGSHHHNHHFDHNDLIGSSSAFRPSASFFQLPADQTSHQDYATGNNNKSSLIHGLMHLPDLHVNAAAVAGSPSMFNLNFFQNNSNNNNNNVVVDHNDNSNISGGTGGLLLPSPNQQFSNNNNSSGEGSNNSSNIFSAGAGAGAGAGIFLSDHHHNHHRHHLSSPSIHSLYVSSSLHQNSSPAPHMSATALLQKATQTGSTTSCNNSSTSASLLKAFESFVGVGGFVGGIVGGGSSSSAMKSDLHDPPSPAVNFGGVYGHDDDPMSARNHFHDFVVTAYAGNQDYGGGVIGGGYNNNKVNSYNEQQQPPQKKQMISNFSMEIGSHEEDNRLTRDFLGVGEIVRSMSTSGGGGGSNNHHHPFGGGKFQ